MIEDRGQLAVAGGALLPPGRMSGSTAGRLIFLHDRVICDSVLGFADRHRRILWLVVLGFYLLAFNGQWRIQPDAALYLSIGRNLAEGKGYTYLGVLNRQAYPGWPSLIAVTFKIFGNDALFAVNTLMAMIALATVAMVYRLFLLHSGRPTAVVISVGVGLTKAFFCYGFELWSDMPFALGVMSVLAGYEGVFNAKRKANLTDFICLTGGILFAAAMRPTIWPLLAALTLAITLHAIRTRSKRRRLLTAAAVIASVIALCFTYSWMSAGSHGFGGVYAEYLINRVSGKSFDAANHPFSANLRDLFGWAASDVLFQTRLGPVCNSALSLLVIALGLGLFRYRALWGFWFCLLLATIMVSQETLDRYFLPVLPLLVFAWWDLLVRINRALPLPFANLAFLSMVLFGGLMNVTKVGGIIVQQRQRPFLASYDKGTFDSTPAFARMLHDHVGDKAIILAIKPYGRVMAYLSDRCVTNPIDTPVAQIRNRPLFVVEPSDMNTKMLLLAAGLVEGPALFAVAPSANHGPQAIAMSLHTTHKK